MSSGALNSQFIVHHKLTRLIKHTNDKFWLNQNTIRSFTEHYEDSKDNSELIEGDGESQGF